MATQGLHLILLFFFKHLNCLLSQQEEVGFIYNGFGQAQADLHLDGAVEIIFPGGLLQLTDASTQQMVMHSSSSHSTDPTLYLRLFNISTNGSPSSQLLAIELDTFQSAEFDDIDKNHVCININSLNSSRPINLTEIFSDQKLFFGFSAATESLVRYQYILGWSFSRSRVLLQRLDLSKLPKIPHPRAKKEAWEKEYGPPRLSYKSLYKTTKGFDKDGRLGKGGFGEGVCHDANQGMKQFVAEVVTMESLKHRNLIPLLGYCRRKGELLLVSEYISNGSVDRYLFAVLKDIASALNYLHTEANQVVLHRDIKASNVMLDSDFHGRL
ncbi:hypothetical protein EUTSA_v10010964mg [Eutrema salsugineum]|uniref:Protein kinase domain-containing protein n=1 Tax=Eutrema salsugineum TaxID=72664 RepID=V4LTQ5_EUTSA|nr:hypothetical protein EUTSA_v10010964mg [Eutrema salsugineum]